MYQVPGRINQSCNLLQTEYGWQLLETLGKRDLIEQIGPPKGLGEEKSQSRTSALDRTGRQLAIAKQVYLVLANVARTKALS